MAGAMTHVYIANEVAKQLNIKDLKGFLLGNLAPDAIMCKDTYQRSDKRKTHFRSDISSDDWYKEEFKAMFQTRLVNFYDQYAKNNDFALGYLTHLLTDQYFHYTIRCEVVNKLKQHGEVYQGKQLMHIMVGELDSIDFMLLNQDHNLFSDIMSCKDVALNYEIEDLIDAKTLLINFDWVENTFSNFRTIKPNFVYYSESDAKQLVKEAINFIIEEIKSLQTKRN